MLKFDAFEKKLSCQMSGFPVLLSGLLFLGRSLKFRFPFGLRLPVPRRHVSIPFYFGIFRVALLFICQGSKSFSTFLCYILFIGDRKSVV